MRGRGLEVVFSIFLGILVVAFVGMGVYTFHPPPREHDARLSELYEQRRGIIDSRPLANLSAEERERVRDVDERISEATKASLAAFERWGQVTSIVLISFATLIMVVSLRGADPLPVISGGLLLGGVFTMLYGVGWIITTDSPISRFVVITVALMITLFFGYVRFVRGRSMSPDANLVAEEAAVRMDDIEQRLRHLEQRLDEAMRARPSGLAIGD